MNRALGKRLLLAVLAVEVLVPAVLVATTSPPRRFAWSMFVESTTTYRYVGTRADGTTVDLDPARAGTPWSGIHYGPQTIELLCRTDPGLVSITRTYNGQVERSQPC